jgi:predicted HAD superfamily Cof-like phosphohydrolase
MVRHTLALEGIDDSALQIASLQSAANTLPQEDAAREDLAREIEAMTDSRHLTFGFMVDAATQIRPVIAVLRPLSKEAFDEHEAVLRGG